MHTCIVYFAQFLFSLSLYKGPKYVYRFAHKNEETFAHVYGDFEGDLGILHFKRLDILNG